MINSLKSGGASSLFLNLIFPICDRSKSAIFLGAALILLLPTNSQAQEIPTIGKRNDREESEVAPIPPIDLLQNVPLEMRDIRQFQLNLAREEDVSIHFIDQGRSSRSVIYDGVPKKIQSMRVTDKFDADIVAEELYPFFGFRGTESLKFYSEGRWGNLHRFTYQQYIGDIETNELLSIVVDIQSGRVVSIDGSMHIDRSLPKEPAITMEDAIATAVNFLSSTADENANRYELSGDHYARVVYREWGEDHVPTPVWQVEIELAEPNAELTHDVYIVYPDHEVRDTIETSDLSDDVRICDGTGAAATVHFCGAAGSNVLPTIRDSAGTCNPPYDCTNYQHLIDILHDFEEMLEDYAGTNCCNLENTNSSNGGAVDFVADATLDGPGQFARSGNVTSIKIKDVTNPNIRKILGHELAHAAIYLANPALHNVRHNSPTYPIQAVKEQEAVWEAFPDMVSVIFANYNGPTAIPKYSTTPDFVSASGQNISDQFSYDQMQNFYTPYHNGRVALHAAYELATRINIEDAVYIMLYAAAYWTDINGNNFVSFSELREAMITAAGNLGTSQVNAVKDAWFDVGVGSSSQGVPNPPRDSIPGSPNPPASVTSVLIESCDLNIGMSYWDIYATSPNADSYNVFFSTGGSYGTFHFLFNEPASTGLMPLATQIDATIKISACNASGCSPLSQDSADISYQCP